MKKRLLFFFLFVFFFLFALPVIGANYSAENNPEFNLKIRTYDGLSTGNLGLVSYNHPGDPQTTPPQLCTLLEGTQHPDVSSLNQIHEYNWANNTPSSSYVTIAEKRNDPSFDYASLVGFSPAMSGQNVLVPNSGYDIGGGKQVMVLYASPNQITLRYAVQDDLSSAGYGIHILGINVNQDLLNQYNSANSQGRSSLPALEGGEIIGTANGEVLVSVRDSGDFLDPRWENDWWFQCDNAVGKTFKRGSITPQPGQPAGTFPSCNPTKTGSIDSRPYSPPSCDPCGLGPTTSSCSTSFKVYDEVSFQKFEGALCTDGQYWLEKSWGGTVTIDPKQTTVPFVGKKGAEDEIKYLADYLEGTNNYYRTYPNGSLYYLDWINYAGVNRKLFPLQYQDKLKANMITRANNSINATITSNVIHDYDVQYNSRVCWDLPVLVDMAAAAFRTFLTTWPLSLVVPAAATVDDLSKYTHYCIYAYDVFSMLKVNYVANSFTIFNAFSPVKMSVIVSPAFAEISGMPVDIPIPFTGWKFSLTKPSVTQKLSEFMDPLHQPPNPSDKDYASKWEAWKKLDQGKWYRLWASIPLVSREDTKGAIVPRLGAGQKDTFTVNQASTIDYVPHVERLNELGKMVQKTLIPAAKKILGVSTEENSTQIENNNSVLADQTALLAQGAPFNPASLDLRLNLPSQAVPGNYQIDAIGTVTLGTGCPTILSHVFIFASTNKGGSCPGGVGGNIFIESGKDFRVNDMGGCGTPTVYMNYGDTYSISVTLDNWDAINCGGQTDYKFPLTASCYMKLTQSGWESNCGTAAPVAPPACGLIQPKNVPVCDKTSITDSNPNDTLCCTNVTAKLDAVESLTNPDYTECIEIINGVPVFNSDCLTYIDQQASRGIAVSLSHPYLKQIWDETANPLTGVFNLFRPSEIPKFEPLDASSTISYNYTSDDSSHNSPDPITNTPKAYSDPGTGTFYYPYLGGIQQAKNWLIKALTPLAQ
jgi:hypothetical protein